MKVKALVAVKTKIFKPCKKLIQIFKFKIKKPVFIRSLRPRPFHTSSKPHKSPPKNRFAAFLSGFRPLKKSEEMDRLTELRSISDRGHQGIPYSSPITPAYVMACGASKQDHSGHEDAEDACRSFENYLVEMIVEEGKVADLTDVEELLHCWKNLKSPVFIDLVCRFYGELCKDLFSPEDDPNIYTPK